MSLLLMFSVSAFFIFSNTNGATTNDSSTAITCGANETWNPCPSYCFPEKDCAKLLLGVSSCTPPSDWECSGKCECSPGFVRENGTCYETSVCCSDPNAELVKCPNPCPGGTCTQPNFTSCNALCKPYGCQCKEGFVKDSKGNCILLSKCPEPCGVNEVWNPCPRYCFFDEYCAKLIYGYYKDCPAPLPDWKCTGTCVCKPGFVRENGICSTPSVACCLVPNTEFVGCNNLNICPKEKCVVRSSLPCKQNGCQCKAGFVYVNGTCSSLCPQPCSENEVCNSCPAHCSFDDTCDKLLLGIIPDCAAPPADWQCSPKCVCKPGLVRENGTCTEPSVCCSDRNAEFVQCPNPCPGGTCNQPDFAPCEMACKQYGCQCKQGFVKDIEGKCIPLDQCPKPCGANETWNPCPSYCSSDDDCAKLLFGVSNSNCSTPPSNWKCTGKCECNPGFVRKNGTCLSPSVCCPGPGTEFVQCFGNNCTDYQCVVQSSLPCKQNGCQCKIGYYRVSKTSCQPFCSPICSGNEICNTCSSYCAFDDTCDRLLLGKFPKCDSTPPFWHCFARCMCKPGLVRYNGRCRERSVCCLDPNSEFVKCPNPCSGGTCDQPDFTPCNMACKEYGCQCKQGYVKDKDGKCIPLAQCPLKCPANQTLDSCPLPCPPEYTCDTFLSGIAFSCPAPPDDDQRVCQPVCKCQSGLIRRNTGGDCIDPNDCCDDPNAEVVSCPNPCPGGTCDKPEFASCKIACKYKGCQCKTGFVKDLNGKCIPLSSCPKSCGVNEVWKQCPNYCTLDDTCFGYLTGQRPVCRPPPGWQCTGRCYCDAGFVRMNGKCVKPESCCTDPKTELVKCPNPCPGGTCVQPSYTPCKTPCQPYGCECKTGFLKDSNGTCVPLSQCPICGENEHFDCGPPSDINCTYLEWDADPYGDCVERCYCNEGYARNSKDICIPIDFCSTKPSTVTTMKTTVAP